VRPAGWDRYAARRPWDIDGGEEFDAVAHGNAVLILGVVRPDPPGEFIFPLFVVGGLRHGEHGKGAEQKQSGETMALVAA